MSKDRTPHVSYRVETPREYRRRRVLAATYLAAYGAIASTAGAAVVALVQVAPR